MPNSLRAVLRECHEKKLHVILLLSSNGKIHVSDGHVMKTVALDDLATTIRTMILGYSH